MFGFTFCQAPAVVIDVGAGTGRDAGAFAAAGYEVIAIKPSTGMQAEAERLHPSQGFAG